MLSERTIAPFTPWRKVGPLFVTDPRFLAIPSDSERKAIYEAYMRTSMTNSKKQAGSEKKAQKKALQDMFNSLLDELAPKISHTTTFEEFTDMARDDDRYNTSFRPLIVLLPASQANTSVNQLERSRQPPREACTLRGSRDAIEGSARESQGKGCRGLQGDVERNGVYYP